MHLKKGKMRKTGRERKLDAPLLKRKVLIGHPTLLEFLCFCVFLCFFVLTSFKSLLGFVRILRIPRKYNLCEMCSSVSLIMTGIPTAGIEKEQYSGRY